VQGIDRVDNSIGYTPDNCVPCCTQCNRIKLDHLTYEEMLLLAPSLRAIREARELQAVQTTGEPRVSGLT
jgi:5-methylcytosine-specific restriction endonuclease McrA